MTIEYNSDRTIIKLMSETDFLGCKIVRLCFNDRSIDSIYSVQMINVYYDKSGLINDIAVSRGCDFSREYDSAEVVSLFSKFGIEYVPDLLRFFADRVFCDSSFIL